MRCPRCQADNRQGVKFCEDCGAPLALTCPHCGAEVLPEKRFCGSCGGSLAAQPAAPAASAAVATPAERFPSPQTYTPQHLAERIFTSRAALEGERKQVTVLFADLKGSMELLTDRDPEEARRILDPVLERMMEAVHRYEGTVNQVMGDGIMALFGAPLAHEDHAVRACYAALRMQEAVRHYADELRRTQGVTPQIRVGINSGEVVVRSIGSDLRMDYTAVGQTTHLAARMEQLATPGAILLAPDTLRLAEDYMQVKPLGPVQVKGLDEPLDVYELISAGTARSRLQAAAARGLTKFVGRDTELETLRRTLDLAGAGHGQIVALVGEPGVGKSRLVWEFTRSYRTQEWLVLESRSVSYGKATPYLPVVDLLKSYCGIEDRDDARRMREKITGKLLTLDSALQPALPALLSLLDVPVDDAAWHALDPPRRRQQTLDALKRLILRESQEQPLLLVLEDLHWIDAATQALLDGLVDSLPTARILLLVSYRPEYEHLWHRKTYYQQLRLDPLPAASAEALLDSLMGQDSGLDPLKQILVERTEGNPFFLEESVRTLVETGTLAGERGAYRLVQPLQSTQVPATVQAVLAARIDRLAPEDKRLLQAAAVIGKDVPYPLLQAIAELREAWLRQGLADLQAAEFVYETSLFPDLEYTFKHALTHEVAYASLLQDRRRALHARIVVAIEQLYPDRLAEQAERLAHHAVRGEVWEKAVRYLRQAGAKAEARSALPEAVGYLEQALVTLGRRPESRETREQAIDLYFDLRRALYQLGETERVLDHLRGAEALATALGDQARLGQVYAHLTNHFTVTGDPEQAVQAGERALAVAAAIGNRAMEIEVRARLGRAYQTLGRSHEAVNQLRTALASLEGTSGRGQSGTAALPTVLVRVFLSAFLADLGEFREGIALAEEVVRLAEESGQPFSLGLAYSTSGIVYVTQGDWRAAIACLEKGLGISEERQIAHQFPYIAWHLGQAYAAQGRVAEAIGLLQQAVERAEAMHLWQWQPLRVTCLGEAYALAGRRDEALDHARQALVLAREHQEPGSKAWALRLLGEIAAHADSPDAVEAETHYRQALVLADALGMRPLQAHCHLGLGALYQKIGRVAEAQAELMTAADLYRAMEMPFWLEKAHAALAQAGVQ